MSNIMKNDLILRRFIHIETWRVSGTLLKAQTRPDITMVLQYVKDNNLNANAKGLAKELLFEERARLNVAERLLRHAELLGLIKKIEQNRHTTYVLTEQGETALSNEKVFIPEEGTWEISFGRDKLLPHMIIDFKPFTEPDAFQESTQKDKLAKRSQNIRPISPWIQEQISYQQDVAPFMNAKQSIRIGEIHKKGEEVQTKHQLVLEWNVSKQSIRLLNREKIIHQDEYRDFSQEDVWQYLLEHHHWQDDWDWSRNSMAIGFDETKTKDRQQMKTDFTFDKPTIDDLGAFDDFIAQDVSIHAISQADAYQWAMWRLENSIRDFADIQNYQQWQEQAKAPFSEYSFSLPERNEFAENIWKNQPHHRKAWYLMAAYDWNI